MKDTSDLSRIINLIMQNPSLVEQISELAKPKNEETAVTPEPESTPEPSSQAFAHENNDRKESMKAHRYALLNAMKPYLSEHRRSAIDSMTSILEVIEVIGRK